MKFSLFILALLFSPFDVALLFGPFEQRSVLSYKFFVIAGLSGVVFERKR